MSERAHAWKGSPLPPQVAFQVQNKLQELLPITASQPDINPATAALFWQAVWQDILFPIWSSAIPDISVLSRAWTELRITMNAAVSSASLHAQVAWLLQEEGTLYSLITRLHDDVQQQHLQSAMLQAFTQPRPAAFPFSRRPAFSTGSSPSPPFPSSPIPGVPSSTVSQGPMNQDIRQAVENAARQFPHSCEFWSGQEGSCFQGDQCQFSASHTAHHPTPTYQAKQEVLGKWGRARRQQPFRGGFGRQSGSFSPTSPSSSSSPS